MGIRKIFAGLMAVCLVTSARADALDNWTTRMSFPWSTLWAVTEGNGLVIAGGRDMPFVYYSSDDGRTWLYTTNQATYQHCRGLTFANGLFVMAASVDAFETHTIHTSTNGLDWTQRYQFMTPWGGPLENGLRAVTSGANGFVAVGSSGTIVRSADGLSWTPVSSGTTAGLWSIVSAENLYVAAGDSGLTVLSTNGMDWTRHASATTNRIHGITYGNNTFVAVGDGGSSFSGVIQSSTTGSNWTVRVSNAPFRLRDVAYHAGMFVAVGTSGVLYTSPDGVNWKMRAPQGYDSIYSVIGVNNAFIAVGHNETILQSDPIVALTATASPVRQLTISGPVGRSYHIQASEDLSLTNWQSLATITVTNNPQTWLDLQSSSTRFYRAVLAP